MHGGGEFLSGHQEIAVARERECTVRWRMQPLHRHRGPHPVSHGAGDGRELGAEAPVAVVAMHPDREVAGPVADEGIDRQARPQSGDDLAHVDGARDGGRRVGPGQELGMGGLGRLGPWDLVGRLQGFEASRECGGGGMNGEMRPIDPAQLLGARMHVHEGLLRARNVEQGVALGGQFAHRPPISTTRSAALMRARSLGLGPMPRSPA